MSDRAPTPSFPAAPSRAKAVAQRCGTCRFLDLHPDSAGRLVARSGKAYRCLYEVSWPALPDSITMSYNFRLPEARYASHRSGDDGTECPTWQVRPKPVAGA